MFTNCKSLETLKLPKAEAPKLKYLSKMFNGCKSLTKVDIHFFNTDNVTSMERMFYGCESLSVLNLQICYNRKEIDMGNLFSGCNSLKFLDISSFVSHNYSLSNFLPQNKGILKLKKEFYDILIKYTDLKGWEIQLSN